MTRDDWTTLLDIVENARADALDEPDDDYLRERVTACERISAELERRAPDIVED